MQRIKSEKPHSTSYKREISVEEESNIKLLPPIQEWPKFSGEGEYDHVSFIKYIDHILQAYQLPENVIIVRLPRLFEGVAIDWFVTKRGTEGHISWEEWKQLIKLQFGTRIWKKNMLRAFESDFFDPLKDKPHNWCLKEKKRLDCVFNHLDKDEINERLLGQCKGHLEHNVK